jgi:septal ring factor EnvC (AmiA/AmiB activator)
MTEAAGNPTCDALLLCDAGDRGAVIAIDNQLRGRGIATWLQGRDVPEEIDEAALASARVTVIFFGPFQPTLPHLRTKGLVLRTAANIIAVFLSSVHSRNELEQEFESWPIVELKKSAGDEQGVRRLIQQISSNTLPESDADAIASTLINGTEDDRGATLDALAAVARTQDHIRLRERLLSELSTNFSVEAETTSNSPFHVQVTRSWLLGALARVAGRDPRSEDLLLKHAGPEEPNASVRFSTLAALYESKAASDRAVRTAMEDSDSNVRALAHAIANHTTPDWLAFARDQLRGGSELSALLRALYVVPVSELVADVCAVLSRSDEASNAYDVFYALSHPGLATEAARALAGMYSMDQLVEFTLQAIRGARSYTAERLARVFRRFDRTEFESNLRRRLDNESDRPDVRRILDLLRQGALDLSIAGYASDSTEKVADDLDIRLEVQTLCSVLLAREVTPPLSIGLFGDWGSGKTFFMERMREEIARITAEAAAGEGAKAFHTRVVQITFNAWHYIDANLWASLVSHILEQLVGAVAPRPSEAETRRALLGELQTAKELKQEAEAEKNRAEQARKDAEKNLNDVAEKRAAKQVELSDLRATDLWSYIEQDPELKAAIDRALRDLGLPAVVTSFKDLDSAVREAHGAAGRARALLAATVTHGSRTSLIVLMLVLLAGAPAVVWLLNRWLPQQPWFVAISTLMAEVAAGMLAAAKAIRKPLAKVNEALARVEEVRAKALAMIESKRKERSDAEAALEKEVNALRAKELSATQQLTAAEARIQEIETKIREIEEGRSLAKYLVQRFQADDYRKHLGLISTIRRDFEKLSDLLRVVDTSHQQPIERIILYVDDLDRCPPERVLDVLQAVHLLLAFPLFVVVVGVDPRWLLHSLEKSFSAFHVQAGENGREWITTPQNYLEKIFQVPFSLRPMEEAGFGRLMNRLLPETAAAEPVRPRGVSVAAAASAAGDASAQPLAPSKTPQRPPARIERTEEPEPAQSMLNLESLRIHSWEAAFARRLYPFIASPRAAKRFTNIYRLLKAPLQVDELPAFEGTATVPGDFRAVMVLLAILNGFPAAAPRVFAGLLAQRETDLTPAALFRDVDALGIAGEEAERFSHCMGPLLRDGMPGSLEPFVKWAPRVARFSFEAAKVTVRAAASA